MDPTVKQMIDGLKMGVEAQSGLVTDKSIVDEAMSVITRMEEIANQPGVDIMKYQELTGAEGLMEKYGECMAKISMAQMAGLDTMVDNVDQVAAEAKPVDLNTIDLTDLSIIVNPHKNAYEATIKNNAISVRQHDAYDGLFALADECKTIPEFNLRAQSEGHYAHLGLAATWDANMHSFKLEIDHKQPDMITWAINTLEATRDFPFPETIAYTLNKLAYENERKMAVRQSQFNPFNQFMGELGAYLLIDHSENQRQKTVNMYHLQKEYSGWDFDTGCFNPYVRQLLMLGDAGQNAKLGPDFLGNIAFSRTGWFLDASLSPEDRKQYKTAEEFPLPPAYKFPVRTGAVGGVELTITESSFACSFDEDYGVTLMITNVSNEPRKLDVDKGVRIWILDENNSLITNKLDIDLPDELAPGAKITIDGDLYGWGLPKTETLYMVGFDLGVVGGYKCDFAVKYGNSKDLTPAFIPNCYVVPFDGGTAPEPVFVYPHRPLPEYPFPVSIE